MTEEQWDTARITLAKLREMAILPDSAYPGHSLSDLPAVSQSPNAVEMAQSYINLHVLVRGAMEPVKDILENGKLCFQTIWGPDSINRDFSNPFKIMVARKEPLFMIAAGYSNGGKSYSLLFPNLTDPPRLASSFISGN